MSKQSPATGNPLASFAEMLQKQIGQALRDFHIAGWGILHRYNPITNIADVRLKSKLVYYDKDDPETKDHELDILYNIKVATFGGGWCQVDVPLYDETNGGENHADVVVLLWSKFDLEKMAEDNRPRLPETQFVGSPGHKNVVALPLRLHPQSWGVWRKNHTWKEAGDKPSVKPRHHYRVIYQPKEPGDNQYNHWLALSDPRRDGRIELVVDKNTEKPYVALALSDPRYGVLFAEPVVKTYNEHQNKDVVPGPDLTGPPEQQFTYPEHWTVNVRVDHAGRAEGAAIGAVADEAFDLFGDLVEGIADTIGDLVDKAIDCVKEDVGLGPSDPPDSPEVVGKLGDIDELKEFGQAVFDEVSGKAIEIGKEIAMEFIETIIPADIAEGVFNAVGAFLSGDLDKAFCEVVNGVVDQIPGAETAKTMVAMAAPYIKGAEAVLGGDPSSIDAASVQSAISGLTGD